MERTQNTPISLDFQIPRSRFLKLTASVFIALGLSSTMQNCKPKDGIPRLKGISEDDYIGFRGLQTLFLEGCPIPDFDLGIALDEYIYGKAYPIETESLIRFLASIPNSVVIAMALDFSPTPLAQLSREDMEKRVLGWKNSSLAMKRGLYSILRQFSFFLLTSDKRFQEYMGYKA